MDNGKEANKTGMEGKRSSSIPGDSPKINRAGLGNVKIMISEPKKTDNDGNHKSVEENNDAQENDFNLIQGGLEAQDEDPELAVANVIGSLLGSKVSIKDDNFIKELVVFLRNPDIKKCINNKVTLEFLVSPFALKFDGSNRILQKKILNRGTFMIDPQAAEQPLLNGSFLVESNSGGNVDSSSKSPLKTAIGDINLSTFKFNKLTHAKSSREVKVSGNIKRHINGYLILAIFLANKFKMVQDQEKLVQIYKKEFGDNLSCQISDMENPASDMNFVRDFLKMVFMYDEYQVYYMFVTTCSALDDLVNARFFLIFVESNRLDYLLNFFDALNQELKKKNQELIKKNQERGKRLISLTAVVTPYVSEPSHQTDEGDKCIGNFDLKLIMLVKQYFDCTQENILILDILSNYGLPKRKIVEIMLDSRDDHRILKIFSDYEWLMDLLTPQDVIDRRLFSVLALFDKKILIDIFNMEVRNKVTVFKELCNLIEAGSEGVEGLCNVAISINETFWDMPKFVKLFKAFESLVRKKSTENEANWLIYVENPLLFYISMIYFFSQMKKQLDFNLPELTELVKDMLNFCISYITNISDENLKMNLFEKDSNGREFLDYVFLVEEMKILEIEQIENLLEQMWDINRSSMQTVDTFMRVDSMIESIKKFNFGVFTKNYETPIEDGDEFDNEFRFASNSVKMRVLPELFWPSTLVIMDFVFSMVINQMQIKGTWDTNWLTNFYTDMPLFCDILFWLRFSNIVSICMKIFAIKRYDRGGEIFLFIYQLTLLLYFLQLVIYPLLLWEHFWVLGNLQMLIVLVNVGYVNYTALSLSGYGAIIRIFFRMSMVTIIFGICSWIIMTLVAYPIHVVFMDFSQPAAGEIFPNYNLFDELYRGILTEFEYVFGAVVLVRPFLEQNLYTYTMTFVMVLFSFFGNIMIANILVAFLTSQFDLISKKAKFLTMQTQYEFIQIYNMKDVSSIFSLPFFLAPLALPLFVLMHVNSKSKKRLNIFLRKVNHVLNLYMPMFFIMNGKLLILVCLRYIHFCIQLLGKGFIKPINWIYLFIWIFAGPFLLIKLWIQDNATMCQIMLNMKKEGSDLLNFDLEDDARSNLASIFNKINRIAQRDKTRDSLDVKQFLNEMGVIAVVDTIGERAQGDGFNPESSNNKPTNFLANALMAVSVNGGPAEMKTQSGDPEETEDDKNKRNEGSESNAFNEKYKQNESVLAQLLLVKYASKNPLSGKMIVDLNFMRDKFKSSISQDAVPHLISFDKPSLMKASIHISEEVETDLNRQIITVSKEINRNTERISTILSELSAVRQKFANWEIK